MINSALLASFNGGNPMLGCILLPLALLYPAIMCVVYVWCGLNNDEPSAVRLATVLGLTCFGIWMAMTGLWSPIPDSAFWNSWRISSIVVTCVAPFVVAWQLHLYWRLRQWQKTRSLDEE